MKDPRLTELTKIALALPETKRKICGRHAQFLIRSKTFAYFLDDHHGDWHRRRYLQGVARGQQGFG
ncbi:MAG TPA: hypothetical protein VNZ03_15355 [Terriglobales bacterium]|jgi:hypothetical protein|nr:hypothetical protein [Terriglobales bacterium]